MYKKKYIPYAWCPPFYAFSTRALRDSEIERDENGHNAEYIEKG